jgi:PIN like domain
VKVFFDHNLSHTLPKALQAVFPIEHEIVALEHKFPRTISDIDWINALNEEGHWIVISGDIRITRNRTERLAFQSSRLTGFFMAPALKKARVLKQLERLCALWDNIVALAGAAAPGALYELPIKTTAPRQLRSF